MRNLATGGNVVEVGTFETEKQRAKRLERAEKEIAAKVSGRRSRK